MYKEDTEDNSYYYYWKDEDVENNRVTAFC